MNQNKLVQTAGVLMALLLGMSQPAHAVIEGVTGPIFNLKATSGYISTGDGNSVYTWGYADADGAGVMQYTGPTLIVNQGDTVTINLVNELPALATSIIFPGQSNVTASTNVGSQAGLITREAAPGGTITYSFVATEPGTYMYHGGSQQSLQLEMGLVGALIVRPNVAPGVKQAYNHVKTEFNHEYLFLLSEVDPVIHAKVERETLPGGLLFGLQELRLEELRLIPLELQAYDRVIVQGAVLTELVTRPTPTTVAGRTALNQLIRLATVRLSALLDAHDILAQRLMGVMAQIALLEQQIRAGGVADLSTQNATLWFINGRNGPDTMLDAQVSWLPNQPYNSVPRMHPGEKLLMRLINAGRDLHPFHTHGNNTLLLARDGRMLESAPGMGPDLATSNFTIQAIPGQTYDATFEWTGKGLNFDVYGHKPGDPLEPFENAADHGKPFPEIKPGQALTLPNVLDRTDGEFYSGSPFLGSSEAPRPGQAQANAFGGYFHMWHSHTEREIVNDDIFPGGMMTMVVIEPHSVTIP